MAPFWLSIVRVLLRDLKHAERHTITAKPSKSQLELLNITIQHTHEVAGLENICVIEEFLSTNARRRETDCMLALFRPKVSAAFCSKYVASILFGWIAEDMSHQFVDSVRIKRKPVLLLPGDTHSDGVRTETTVLFRQRTRCKHLYISLVIRKEHEFDTLITSAELYTMFSTAAKQASRQPLVDFVEVRMLVVYSQWVRVVTAKTTLSYITSIVEGCDISANQMEIHQTPWLNFTTILGQQCVLLALFESIRMQSPDVKPRAPLRDVAPSEQNLKSGKRKSPTAENCGSKKKKKKLNHIPDATKDTSPIF